IIALRINLEEIACVGSQSLTTDIEEEATGVSTINSHVNRNGRVGVLSSRFATTAILIQWIGAGQYMVAIPLKLAMICLIPLLGLCRTVIGIRQWVLISGLSCRSGLKHAGSCRGLSLGGGCCTCQSG